MNFPRVYFHILLIVLSLGLAIPCSQAASETTGALEAAPRKSFRIYSDLDDTVKVMNVKSVSAMLKHTFSSPVTFAAMPALYQELEASRIRRAPEQADLDRLTFVSNSPTLIQDSLVKKIKRMGFPDFEVSLRDISLPALIREGLAKIFKRSAPFQLPNSKYRRIEQMLLSSNTQAILIGDDGEYDYEIYTRLKEIYPDKIAAIYIRQVYGEKQIAPKTVTVFSNAFELALYEYNAGRLEVEAVTNIGNEILRTVDRESIDPLFARTLDPIEFPETPRSGLALEGIKQQVRYWIQTNSRVQDWRYMRKALPPKRPPEFSRAHAIMRFR